MGTTSADRQAGVSPQAEEYLEAICRVLDRGETVTLTELANELRVAPPSVIGMLRRMEEQELVRYERRTGVQLTGRGQQCAATLRRRHRLAERLLTDLLGMPWDRAHDVACRFEHVIDDEVEGYLLTALHHPTTCPHGNPLDGGSARGWRPLASLAPGETGRLRCILDESTALLDYLQQLSLQPGALVTVCAFAPFDGPLTVEIAGERHALSRAIADCLLVDIDAGEVTE